jgi:hypothetical protein
VLSVDEMVIQNIRFSASWGGGRAHMAQSVEIGAINLMNRKILPSPFLTGHFTPIKRMQRIAFFLNIFKARMKPD